MQLVIMKRIEMELEKNQVRRKAPNGLMKKTDDDDDDG